jgi:leukotriene-A4 hydrolase
LDIVDVEIAGKSVTVSRLFHIPAIGSSNFRYGQFEIKAKHDVMGSALHIDLPAAVVPGQYVDVKIMYQTMKDGTALQWLDKEWVP